MYKATRDLILPTTITGSLPRPRWYTENLRGRSFRLAMTDLVYNEQYQDAVSVLIRDQERAGIDVLSDGDSRLDADVGGASWNTYPAQRLTGVEGAYPYNRLAETLEYGTINRECEEARQAPVVVGKVGRGPLEYTPLWKVAQRMTTSPVRFGTPAPEILEHAVLDRYYHDRKALMLDLADVLNEELTQLARAGCPAIQIEAPWITRAAVRQRADVFEPEFYVDLFHRTTRGLRDLTEIWAHICWGNGAAQSRHARIPSYENGIDLMDALKCDVVTFESASSGNRDLEMICTGIKTKKIAIGVVSHRTLQVESPAQVADSLRQALQWVPIERLIATSDCGFGREGMNRRIAFYKMVSTVRGANIIRAELGLPERPCLAADPAYSLVD